MKIALLIRSLELGGAERQIGLLAAGLRALGHDVQVLTFYEGGQMAPELRAAGLPLYSLGKIGRWDIVGFAWRLLRRLRQERPAILYTFMPSANLMGLLAKTAQPSLRLIWGIRASPLDLDQYDAVTGLTYRIERRLAPVANRIISNSQAGLAPFARTGYPAGRMAVIPNGVDTDRFRPLPDLGQATRQAWAVAPENLLIGIVARIDPMKDHATFVSAAAEMATTYPQARFAVIGTGSATILSALQRQAAELGIADRFLWLGAGHDMPAVYNALDLLVLSSAFGEGFPNVLIEALACGTACVATDVGESAAILETPLLVVAPRQPRSLAAAILLALASARDPQAMQARRDRVVARFSLAALARRTEAVFRSLS